MNKSGRLNMDPCFLPLAFVLLLVIAYSLATFAGQVFKKVGVDAYVARLKKPERKHPRHSELGMGLYGYAWCYGIEAWEQWTATKHND